VINIRDLSGGIMDAWAGKSYNDKGGQLACQI